MWVFGYGSLMWDQWETAHKSLRRVVADLPNYRRAFNKASVRNWGTKKHPGPTLNLMRADGQTCRGMAFEFPCNMTDQVLAELKRREGGFRLEEVPIRLMSGEEVRAVVTIYEGQNLIAAKPVEEVARMVAAARGTSGSCLNYMNNIAAMMRDLEIDDPAITALATTLELQPGMDAESGARRTP